MSINTLYKHKFGTIIAALFLSAFASNSAAHTPKKAGNISWKISRGTLTISGSGAMPNYFYPSRRHKIRWSSNVVIENDVTSIGNLLYCDHVTSIIIPESVTSINFSAFAECSSLTSIDVNKNNPVYASENGVLFNKAKSVLIKYPAGKADINYDIPNSVTSIVNNAFSGCRGLTSVTIPNSVTSIESKAFSFCRGLTSVTIPNSVKYIGYRTFAYCERLSSVTIPNSVTYIEDNAFAGCSGLKSIYIPSSVTFIHGYAFVECSGLVSIDVDDNNTVFASKSGVLFNKEKTILIQYPAGKTDTNYIVSNSTMSIRILAFRDCYNLKSVFISESVTSIGNGAFYGCSGLISINVDDNNTEYTSENGVLFNKAKSELIQYPVGRQDKNYIIPNSVTTIGWSAFDRCLELTSITIPESITTIRNGAFGNNSSLIKIINFATTPQSIDSFSFYEKNKIARTLRVPAASIEANRAAEVWKDFANIEAIISK